MHREQSQVRKLTSVYSYIPGESCSDQRNGDYSTPDGQFRNYNDPVTTLLLCLYEIDMRSGKKTQVRSLAGAVSIADAKWALCLKHSVFPRICPKGIGFLEDAVLWLNSWLLQKKLGIKRFFSVSDETKVSRLGKTLKHYCSTQVQGISN